MIKQSSSRLSDYCTLLRLGNPTGTLLLLFPCYWGMALAQGSAVLQPRYWYLWLAFAIGALLMRSAGCVWNDIVDRKIDAQVTRTKNRPIAAGRISVRQAVGLIILLLLAAASVLLLFNALVLITAILIIPVIIIYPFAKKFTNWPQLILGMAFNWGIWLGWFSTNSLAESRQITATDFQPAVDTLIAIASGEGLLAPLLLYCAALAWTIGYDTIYATQDLADDQRIGVKSTARLFSFAIKPAVGVFYFIFVALLATSIWSAADSALVLILLLLVAGHCGKQIWQLNSRTAFAQFRSNVNLAFWVLLIILLGVS